MNHLFDLPLRQAARAFEKMYVETALTRTGGKVAKAAAHAGQVRTDFYRFTKRHGLLGYGRVPAGPTPGDIEYLSWSA